MSGRGNLCAWGYDDADDSARYPPSFTACVTCRIRLPRVSHNHGSVGRVLTTLPDCARDAEELDKLVDEAHHEEPRVACHLGARDQHAPEQDQHDRVKSVADVSQSERTMIT